jgi:hypothetical protein
MLPPRKFGSMHQNVFPGMRGSCGFICDHGHWFPDRIAVD